MSMTMDPSVKAPASAPQRGSNQQTAAEAIVDALFREGIKAVFGMTGDTVLPLLYARRRRNSLRHHQIRNEHRCHGATAIRVPPARSDAPCSTSGRDLKRGARDMVRAQGQRSPRRPVGEPRPLSARSRSLARVRRQRRVRAHHQAQRADDRGQGLPSAHANRDAGGEVRLARLCPSRFPEGPAGAARRRRHLRPVVAGRLAFRLRRQRAAARAARRSTVRSRCSRRPSGRSPSPAAASLGREASDQLVRLAETLSIPVVTTEMGRGTIQSTIRCRVAWSAISACRRRIRCCATPMSCWDWAASFTTSTR